MEYSHFDKVLFSMLQSKCKWRTRIGKLYGCRNNYGNAPQAPGPCEIDECVPFTFAMEVRENTKGPARTDAEIVYQKPEPIKEPPHDGQELPHQEPAKCCGGIFQEPAKCCGGIHVNSGGRCPVCGDYWDEHL